MIERTDETLYTWPPVTIKNEDGTMDMPLDNTDPYHLRAWVISHSLKYREEIAELTRRIDSVHEEGISAAILHDAAKVMQIARRIQNANKHLDMAISEMVEE